MCESCSTCALVIVAGRLEVVGNVELEGIRPVGGMEMGGKALYCHQPTLRLRKDDGEITVVTLDENTEVHEVR